MIFLASSLSERTFSSTLIINNSRAAFRTELHAGDSEWIFRDIYNSDIARQDASLHCQLAAHVSFH